MSNNVIPQSDPPTGDLIANPQAEGLLPVRFSYRGTLTSTVSGASTGNTITYDIVDLPAGTFGDEGEYGNDAVLPNFVYLPPEDPGYGLDQFTFRIYDVDLDLYSLPAIVNLRVDPPSPMPDGRNGDRVKTDSGIAEINVYATKNYQFDPVASYTNEEVFGTVQADPFCDIWVNDGLGGFIGVWRYLVLFDDNTEGWVDVDKVLSITTPENQLANGEGVIISGADGETHFFTINVTEPIYNLVVKLSGTSGDADLYIRYGSQVVPPDPQDAGGVYDKRSNAGGSNETLTVANPFLGVYHIMVQAWYDRGAFTNATLRATWSTTPPVVPTDDTPNTDVPILLSSITRHGVKWTFNQAYLCGQYCNRDWWVQGPIKIIAIDNRSGVVKDYDIHGTVVNPELGPNQGFDYRRFNETRYYQVGLNASKSLPDLNVAVDSSVVSAVSLSALVDFRFIEVFSVLTVVSAIPDSGAFRPCYIGTGSRASTFNKSQLDYTKLRKLAPLASTPDISELADAFEKCWYEQDLDGTGRYLHTKYMAWNAYGKDMAIQTGNAALLLNLNYSDVQKERLLINFVQYGLDIYGIIQAGGNWYDTGGHNCGRMAPLMIAAAVLNNSAMKAALAKSESNFSETRQCFFVSQTDVDLTRYTADGRPRLPYTSGDIGMEEWGETHSYQPNRDGNNWNAFYRDICGGQLTAPAMAARVLGLRGIVSWEPFFLYQERHLNYEQSGSNYNGEFNANATPSFHKQFYNAYRIQFP